MKHNKYLLLAALTVISCNAMSATIVLDGNKGDWAGIAPLIIDPSGTIGTPSRDMTALTVTNDSTNVYFLFETVGDPNLTVNIIDLDTDMNASTGCSSQPIGVEFGMSFGSGVGFIGDARDCISSAADFPGALNMAYGPNFVELSVPLSTLYSITPNISGITLRPCCDTLPVATYLLQTVPLPPSLLLIISGLPVLLLKQKKGSE